MYPSSYEHLYSVSAICEVTWEKDVFYFCNSTQVHTVLLLWHSSHLCQLGVPEIWGPTTVTSQLPGAARAFLREWGQILVYICDPLGTMKCYFICWTNAGSIGWRCILDKWCPYDNKSSYLNKGPLYFKFREMDEFVSHATHGSIWIVDFTEPMIQP